jgi:hypothetical protein
MKKKILASVLVSAFPLLAFAQYAPNQGITGLIRWFSSVLGLLFPVLIALAVIYFIWQVFQYTIAADEETKGKARGQIIMGIVGIFIMVSVWGLVAILQSTFGTGGVQGNIGNPIPVIQ